ncbi:class I SAM-dependent methyltransferase [Rhizobium sp. PL01]|uniref:class I SAM-dependent methyltransferase n=1 Tax=Rhizobium sp. PL01 TaxID=3085631 RepID=UPI002981A892|nr:class I SAM-dependent methyltransferase [Rhizobium sp. PL01]MDW5317786.1 class I SAM-dependent methyltransferase [Rhizobium sp. PL01]
MAGLIGGNGIKRVVQCGHYVGFSSLMFGFLMRSMGQQCSVYSVDIDQSVTDYTNSWLDRAELTKYVKLAVNDSAAANNVSDAAAWLGGAPQMVLIDSSHQYAHTLRELDLWYDHLAPGGFLLMHDVSIFAQQYDADKAGGVMSAVNEWCQRRQIQPMLINRFAQDGIDANDLVYKDGCGMGIIQKSWS